jgi:ribosomal protein L15
MQKHNLKRAHKNKKDRMVGRGGKHAKTSGRGGKGQTARAGNKRRPELRDIIKKLPKNRGYRFNSVRQDIVLSKEKAGVKAGEKGEKGTAIKYSEIRKRLGIKGRKIIVK